MNTTQRRWVLACLIILGVGACTDSSENPVEVRDPSDVDVITLDPAAPTLQTDSVSFYAVQGKKTSVEIYFDSAGTQTDRLLRFEVGKKSLDRLPGGQKVGSGDSVLITIWITDPATLQFDFAPAGLKFKSKDPAILTIGYAHAMGAVSAPASIYLSNHDDHSETDLAVWLQETAGGSFIRLDSKVDTQLKEIEAEVPGFSRYAVAY